MPPRVAGILSHTVTAVPVGPVAAFTAWNFPVNLPARKPGGALAAGCSVVRKPAEETPASALALVQCLLDAGLPAGVLHLVWGEHTVVGQALISHPAIRKVSLTGSVAVGRLLAEQCAREGKLFAGELGGHAPVTVCEDADPAFVLKLSVPRPKFRNAGQVCASPIRFLVHRRHHHAWLQGICGRRPGAAPGPGPGPGHADGPADPCAPAGRHGALKRARQFHRLRGDKDRTKFIALKQGYHGVHFGGMSVNGNTNFRRPYEPLLPGCLHIDSPWLYRNAHVCGDSAQDEAELGRIVAAQLERETIFQGPDTLPARADGAGVGAEPDLVATAGDQRARA